MSARRADFLAGLRVLELGDGVAGAAACSILWALGAEVTTATDVASPHRRGWPQAPSTGGTNSLLAATLDRGKRTVTAPDPQALGDLLGSSPGYDIVVVDRVLGAREGLDDIERYAAFVEQHNRLAWVTISAFGLTGTRGQDVATELTVAAASGMLGAVRDERTGQPLKLGGQQSLLNVGQAAALAACHAVDLATTDAPVHLDLSAVEATLAMGPVLEVGAVLLSSGSVGGAKRYGAPAGFYACVDGSVRISAMEDHQWRGVVAAMGEPAWAEGFGTVQARIDDPDAVDERVAAWTRDRTKHEVEATLQSHGVPATAVYSPAEILASPQLAHREAFEPMAVADAGDAQVVGLPFRVVDGGNEHAPPGRRRRRSLRGLRMLEASRVLAVPLCGAILGTLGAEVTKLEDLPRLDMYRRRGPYVDGEPGIERSAYFALMNHSKGSAGFDVDADRGHLDELLGSVDVVIENLGSKRGRALGLAASTALTDHPDLLAVTSSGFGQDGPHAAYRAYAYNLQASCALGDLTRTEEGTTAEIDIAWADLISAYALATIIAAWAVGPEGNAGAGIDFSMADLVVAHFNEHLAAASLELHEDQRGERANHLAPYAPHGVYPTTDGWVAIAVDGDEQFAGLVAVLGDDALRDSAFADGDSRLARRRDLDALVGASTGSHAAAALAEELRARGVIAERVLAADDLVQSPNLASRDFFVPVEHPEWGTKQLIGIPWRAFGEPPLELRPPPVLAAAVAPAPGLP